MVESELIEILRRFDLKITPVRLQVLNVLIKSDVALSHSDITDAIGDSSIDKVTLYRTLNVFNEIGLIHKVATEDRNWLYAIMLYSNQVPVSEHDHAHFVCDSCDKIFCFPISSSSNKSMVSIKEGFEVRE